VYPREEVAIGTRTPRGVARIPGTLSGCGSVGPIVSGGMQKTRTTGYFPLTASRCIVEQESRDTN